ncbi:HOOK protein-domain-containing protein [Crassisporium funariophilum]|nr:HOOK protein-domain-containing protein [Crassisporium funariophilum]
MSESLAQRKEIDAFFNFFATFNLARPVTSISDLSDGAALFEVLSLVDPEYFRQNARSSAQPSENWVLRFSALKRLYRLMTQYFADVLQKPTSSLDVPDLQGVAKDHSLRATLTMCRLTIVIGVQCEKNKEFIDKIQGLGETDQHYLMKAIEQVMAKIAAAPGPQDMGDASMTEDDHYYRIQSERSLIFTEKETLEKVYTALLEEHRALQTTHDDVLSEKEDAQTQLRQLRREVDGRRNEKADVMMRAEMDRLRAELQKSEDNLAMAETELDKHTTLVTDLTRKVDELQVKADEAERLKDQVDEYRHAADKLQKTENVMEKYKKKLQEGADLRQHVKALERQNASLVDKNASLEEEYRKVAAFKPLMESYKTQILDLESKSSARAQEIDALNFQLEQSRTKLKIAQGERAKDAEALELYQERVRELELMGAGRGGVGAAVQAQRREQLDSGTLSAELNTEQAVEGDADTDADGDDHRAQNLGGELDDAVSGTTMTDLKLQIRRLTRELSGARKNEADASRILVLENLLEDATRMKGRYEGDYLAAHREKLVLMRDLEEIRSGRSLGDGAEAAIALRQRLNETVEQFETLRKDHTELEVKFDTLSRELTIAKSDRTLPPPSPPPPYLTLPSCTVTLVNKDQLDILASLRESVNEDKLGLEADVAKLKKHNRELGEKNRMQLEQVNALLLEKVSLQSEGIGHREKMLQRERDFGDLRATMSGKDLPEDIKTRLLAMHEDNLNLKESLKTSTDKLNKAKQFIKAQDKLFKEQHATTMASAPQGTFEEAETSFRSQIKVLEEDLARQKRLMHESRTRYRREQELMLSALHTIGMKTVRQHIRAPPRIEKTSFLGIERNRSAYALQTEIGGRGY